MKVVYPACFYKEKDGGFSVQFPDLLGCCTQGDTLEEAIQMAEDAALGWLLTSVENNEEVPKASDIKDVKLENENVYNLYCCSFLCHWTLSLNDKMSKWDLLQRWIQMLQS